MGQDFEHSFGHEKLDVYRESIAFIAWLSAILEGMVKAGDIKDQLDRASSSIPLNIAEGNGKYSARGRCRYFDIAHGSALECAAGLDVLVAKSKATQDQICPGKEMLVKIVRMLMGLIQKNSTRPYERTTAVVFNSPTIPPPDLTPIRPPNLRPRLAREDEQMRRHER